MNTSPAQTGFVFNNSYDDHEQVRPYMRDFLAVYADIEVTGRYTYNDSFRGRIPGLAGPDEDTGIYLLQKLKCLDELATQVATFLADGGRELTQVEGDVVKYRSIVCYGFYMGGTGWRQYDDARLVARGSMPWAILPKGKRTNGHLVSGTVLVK